MKVNSRVARKEFTCDLGCIIHPGDKYYFFSFYRQRRRVRCLEHYPKSSELTQNDKLSTIYSLMEEIGEYLKGSLDIDSLAALLDESANSAREIRGEFEETASNIEEYFPNSPQADEQRDRGDLCEQWATELENAAGEIRDYEGTEEEGEDVLDHIAEIAQNALDSLQL